MRSEFKHEVKQVLLDSQHPSSISLHTCVRSQPKASELSLTLTSNQGVASYMDSESPALDVLVIPDVSTYSRIRFRTSDSLTER